MGAAVLSADDFYSWSLSQLSREFGVARETVGSRIRAAGIQPSCQKRGHPAYRVSEVAQAILVPVSLSDGDIHDPGLMVPKERSDWYKSENERIKFEKDTGVLTSVEECREQMGEIAKMGLQILETLPDMLERDFELAPEIIEGVELKVDALRLTWAEALEA